jgi:hypothetical protein
MICMKARDYLTLIKWLDLQRGNNLMRFCLVPKFQLPQSDLCKFCGKWGEYEEPEIGEGFEYLLDFYVMDDERGPLEDGVLTSVQVIVCPGRVECDATIPGDMLRDKIAAVIREYDKEWAERWEQGNWFSRLFRNIRR